mmetsp:Transcript_967/g.2645  ORF Transcript_967/g.2645 Transcript_967/m.2645 type:complete len:391 (-) Transcript_967:608-1780(-)
MCALLHTRARRLDHVQRRLCLRCQGALLGVRVLRLSVGKGQVGRVHLLLVPLHALALRASDQAASHQVRRVHVGVAVRQRLGPLHSHLAGRVHHGALRLVLGTVGAHEGGEEVLHGRVGHAGVLAKHALQHLRLGLGRPGQGDGAVVADAGACLAVAHGGLGGAAVRVVVAAHTALQGAAVVPQAQQAEQREGAGARLLGGALGPAKQVAHLGHGLVGVLLHGVRRDGGDTAQAAWRGAALELEVAAVAPRPAPRVLDEPVVSALLGAIAHHQHTMVQLVAALIDNAARVELHGGGRADAHTDRLARRSLEQVVLAVGHVLEAVNGHHGAVRLLAPVAPPQAHAPPAPVAIILLSIQTSIVYDILVGIVHEAAPTSHILLCVTVNQLLLT